MATPLFSLEPTRPFSGSDYVASRDGQRLERQLDRIIAIVIDGEWRTIEKLVAILRRRYPLVRFPENSVQAQLRNLRKISYGVEKRHIGRGLFEYRVTAPLKPTWSINESVEALLCLTCREHMTNGRLDHGNHAEPMCSVCREKQVARG